MTVSERMSNAGLVPVVVLENAADAVPTARALLAGGAISRLFLECSSCCEKSTAGMERRCLFCEFSPFRFFSILSLRYFDLLLLFKQPII